MASYEDITNKMMKATDEASDYFDKFNFKRAKECLNNAKKYHDLLTLKYPYIMIEVNDLASTISEQLDRCEHILSLLDQVYDAVQAEQHNSAINAYNQCCHWFKVYRNDNTNPLGHAEKFQTDIINALKLIEQNKNNCFARQKLNYAKQLAKDKKFDEALNELSDAELYAGNLKIMKLLWDEQLKVEKDRQHEKEVREAEECKKNAYKNLELATSSKKNLQFQDAFIYYERAASFAREESLKQKIKTEKRDLLQRAYNSYINEAEALVKENKCEAAYSKFDEATRMAKDPLLERKYLIDLEAKINSSCNARAQYLHKIANDFLKENKLNEAKEKFQEALCFAKDNLIRTSIIADRDKELIREENDNKRAMQLLQIGQGHVIKNEFKPAELAFQSALNFAVDEALKAKIKTEDASANSKHVKCLQNEANDLLRQNKFKESIDKFEEAVYIVKDDSLKKSVEADKSKAVDQYVKLLIDQANELVKQNKFKQAYDTFETALNVGGGTSNTVRICKEQANALNQEGMIRLKEAFVLESSEPFTEAKYKEAEKKINRAQELFTKAENTSETKQKKNIEIVESKIKGNKCFNDALLTEEEAVRFYENAKKCNQIRDYTSAQEKYQKAKELFEEAKKHFANGLKLGCEEFRVSINLASDQASNIPKVITSINMLKLKCNDSKLDKELEKVKNKL